MSGVYQVVVGNVDPVGNFWENVFHFTNDESIPGSPWSRAEDMAQSWLTTMSPLYLALMSQDARCNIISAKRVSAAGGPTAFATIDSPGTIATPMCSAVMAVDVAVFPGGLHNRAGHIFLSGLPNDAILGGVIQAAWGAACHAFNAGLLAFNTTNAGDAITYGTFTKSTKACTTAVNLQINTKVTGLNKRTSPVL